MSPRGSRNGGTSRRSTNSCIGDQLGLSDAMAPRAVAARQPPAVESILSGERSSPIAPRSTSRSGHCAARIAGGGHRARCVGGGVRVATSPRDAPS